MLQHRENEIVGLVPAAGKATRIQPLPCSKELLPVGFQSIDTGQGEKALRPKVVSQYLLESMGCAGARIVYMVIRRGKWDIPAYYGPGTSAGVDVAYVVTNYPYGAPFSLKQAFPFVSQATILFGFPDIRLTPTNAFTRLLAEKKHTRSDLVLGLFRARDPSKMDMVRLTPHGAIASIDIKPTMTTLTYTWLIAVWSPAFTAFMKSHLEDVRHELKKEHGKGSTGWGREYYVGHVIQAALSANMRMAYVIFEEGSYIDIGTPKSLFEAINQIGTEEGKNNDHR